MRKISKRVEKEQKLQSIRQGNMQINEHQTSNLPQDKNDTSQLFFNKKELMMDDTIQLTQVKQKITTSTNKRKNLPVFIFIGLIIIEAVFTYYPAVIFTRKSGVYEFFVMNFTFPIVFACISIYLVRDLKQLLLLYFMLDPLMIITLCLVTTFIFPYVAMDRVNATQILQEISYFICNIAMVGNYRIILLYMKWSVPRVIFYKLSRMGAILFYLIFGTIYVLDDISYSKGADSDLDDKVQNLVILFVFSGFALQLQIFNRASDFDGTSDLKVGYLIVTQDQQQQQQAIKQVGHKSDNGQRLKQVIQQVIQCPKIKLSPIIQQNNKIKIMNNKPILIQNKVSLNKVNQ